MATLIQNLPLRRKKILVLITRGGGGHVAAGDSLKEILGDDFDVAVSNVITEIFSRHDPVHHFTRGKYSGEGFYNFLLKRHHSRFIQWLVSYTTSYTWRPRKVENSFQKYLQTSGQPDLIISATPFLNYGVLCAAEKKSIPFLLVPTDLDGSTFLQGFPKQAPYKNFKLALAYDDPDVRNTTLGSTHLHDDAVTVAGFPVRPAYLKNYSAADVERLQVKYGLLPTHRTATLIMGALGGNLILEHAKALAHFDPRPHGLSLQINVCVGHNRDIGTRIAKELKALGATPLEDGSCRLPSGLVFHIRGFTKAIAEIMAASDLIITKTGSCTVNEAIYLQKPVLLDNTARATARHLRWEQFNIPFIQKHGLGAAFSDSHQLHMLIPSMLKFPEMKKRKPFELPHFEKNIRKIVRDLLYPK